MNYLLYFVISLIATTAGALTGMGGGVLIKPGLDLLNQFPAKTISVLSSLTVFSMSVVSIGKHVQQKTRIPYKTAILLAIGSIVGGIAGQFGLTISVSGFQNNRLVLITQNAVLVLLVICVLLYMQNKSRIKSLGLTGILPLLLAGVLLGFFSSFLGVGGGPFNVVLLIYLFSLDTKSAVVCSIVIIFFSQLANIASIAMLEGFAVYDLSLLPPMIAGGIIGGFSGVWINRKISEKQVECAFNTVLFIVGLMCLYNIVRNILFVAG